MTKKVLSDIAQTLPICALILMGIVLISWYESSPQVYREYIRICHINSQGLASFNLCLSPYFSQAFICKYAFVISLILLILCLALIALTKTKIKSLLHFR